MTETARLIDQFDRAHHGDAWHGQPLTEILKGVSADQAAARPPNGAHSIWALVLHITAWRNEVAARGRGKASGDPAEGDWPEVGDPTPARWQDALTALDAAHENLVNAVRDMSDEQLSKPTIDPRYPPLGTGVSHYELFHGVVQHDAYHAGQIAILKKVLGL
jgi:uncharacterized damage-inducible protein DinB